MDAFITVDLGFGDSAKGATIDYLSHLYPNNVAIRYSGGPQAAHNVVQPDGRHHTFRQIGSGSFVPTSKTFLSRYMLVNPTSLLYEWDALSNLDVNLNGRVFVSENAQIVLPWYATATQIREILRGDHNHGSTGEGISEARRDALTNRDVLYIRDLASNNLETKLQKMFDEKSKELIHLISNTHLSDNMCSEIENVNDESFEFDSIKSLLDDYELFMSRVQIVPDSFLQKLATNNTLLFEAAQGVLLDEYYGFHPYNTWTNTTSQNADTLLSEIKYAGKVTTYGLLRSYQTRHGAGPLPTQSAKLNYLNEQHNGTEKWAGEFRNGYLDMVLLKYALRVNPVDELVISHLDAINSYEIVTSYNNIDTLVKPIKDLDKTNTNILESVLEFKTQKYHNEKDFITAIKNELNTPITITAHGMTHTDRKEMV